MHQMQYIHINNDHTYHKKPLLLQLPSTSAASLYYCSFPLLLQIPFTTATSTTTAASLYYCNFPLLLQLPSTTAAYLSTVLTKNLECGKSKSGKKKAKFQS